MPEIVNNAGIAYVHYLSFMVCFAALVLEPGPLIEVILIPLIPLIQHH